MQNNNKTLESPETISEDIVQQDDTLEQLELPKKINVGSSTLDLDDLLQQFKSIFSSPNPFAFYSRINGIKYKLSNFINNVTSEIVEWFSWENSTSIYSLYYQSEYHRILLSTMESYLYESKYFDLKFYFEAVVTFDKSKLNLAKWLLKFYKKEKEPDIQRFLKVYNEKRVSYNKIRWLYEELGIEKIKIDPQYLDEFKIYSFLEKLYFELGEQKKQVFLSEFNLSLESKWFKEIYDIFRKINMWYIDKEFSSRCRTARLYINNKEFLDLRNKLDIMIINYNTSKNTFYENVHKLIEEQNVEKKYFWWYLKTQMINTYFHRLKRIFYWRLVENLILDRLLWNSLSWNINQDETDKFLYSEHTDSFIKKLFWLKSIIIQLNGNIWWPFLKPLVYALIIEHLKVDAKSFDKIQFILCFIIPKDYGEYKIIFNFFNEIKCIYGIWINWTKSTRFTNLINKLKISASLIILFIIVTVLLAKTAPIWFFLSIFLLWVINFSEFLFSNYFNSVRWNLWIKTYLIIASMIFGFSWIINLWKTLEDGQSVLNAINQMNKYSVTDVVDDKTIKNVGNYVANIFWK